MRPLVTLADLAATLNEPISTTRHRRHRGELPPAIKIGRSVRWHPEQIEAWLAGQRERP